MKDEDQIGKVHLLVVEGHLKVHQLGLLGPDELVSEGNISWQKASL